MKKTVAILLLSIVFISQLGYYFVLGLQQYQARREMKLALLATIPESELEIITSVHEDQLRWEEDGKEFSFRGQMYDVVKMKVLHGKTFYYCLNDKKEQQLLDRLANVIKSSTDDSKNTSGKNIIKFQSADSELPNIETVSLLTSSKPQYSGFTARLAYSDSEIQIPPPRG